MGDMNIKTWCESLTKILLFIFNAIFWALGVAILAAGVWLKTNPVVANYSHAFQVAISAPVVEIGIWVFIGAGIFAFAVGFVGCLGIIRESKMMLGFYIICIFLVFCAEVSVGAYTGITAQQFDSKIKKQGKKFLQESYTAKQVKETSNATIQDFIRISNGFNYLQQHQRCCGVNDFTDYNSSAYLKEQQGRITDGLSMSFACCQGVNTKELADGDLSVMITADERQGCLNDFRDVTGIWLNNDEQAKQAKLGEALKECGSKQNINCKGCYQQLKDEANKNLQIIMIIGITIGILQLILLILALFFCLSVKTYEKPKQQPSSIISDNGPEIKAERSLN